MMEKTTLQRSLEELDLLFDKEEAELKEMRRKQKTELWRHYVDSGQLKAELN